MFIRICILHWMAHMTDNRLTQLSTASNISINVFLFVSNQLQNKKKRQKNNFTFVYRFKRFWNESIICGCWWRYRCRCYWLDHESWPFFFFTLRISFAMDFLTGISITFVIHQSFFFLCASHFGHPNIDISLRKLVLFRFDIKIDVKSLQFFCIRNIKWNF